MLGKILFVTLLGFLSLDQTEARCSKSDYTKRFGRIQYDPTSNGSAESCTWRFIPPKEGGAVLILKLVSFPYSLDADASQNYIQLPGGAIVNRDGEQENLYKCKKFVKPDDQDACSTELLEEYCAGPIINATDWPPKLTSYSSQISKIGSYSAHHLGFTVSYVFVSCPKAQAQTEKTLSATEKHPLGTYEKSAPTMITGSNENNTVMIKTIGTLSLFLFVALCISIFFLYKNWRKAKRLSRLSVLSNNYMEAPYAFAVDTPGTLTSNGYATVGSLRSLNQENITMLPNGYLTMRRQGTRDDPYEEIKNKNNTLTQATDKQKK